MRKSVPVLSPLVIALSCLLGPPSAAQEPRQEQADEKIQEEKAEEPEKIDDQATVYGEGVAEDSRPQRAFIQYNYTTIEDYGIFLGGRFVADIIRYGHANERDNGVELDTVRPVIRGEHGERKEIRWWLEPDLLGVDTPRNLYEAWGSYEFFPSLRIKAGQFPMALGTEFGSREERLPMAGYGYTSQINGRWDVGLRLEGSLWQGVLWYEGTVAAGEGFGNEGRRQDGERYAARTVWHPFRRVDPAESIIFNRLKGFYLGAGFAYDHGFDNPFVFTTPYESRVFSSADVDADYALWLHLESGYYVGAFRVGYEINRGRVRNVPVGGGVDVNMNEADTWTVFSSYNITGEKHRWERGGWTSPHVTVSDWSWTGDIWPGRWEVAGRVSDMDMDSEYFAYGFAQFGMSSRRARTWALNLNWYPKTDIRVSLGWALTNAKDDLFVFGNHRHDSSYLLRFELAF